MANATPFYSTLFHCLHDEKSAAGARFPRYTIFRAVDSRNVSQELVARPRVHDFAVIWDDDDDTRIIDVIEEMLMEGLLPGVQFIGEHKGVLTIILAARTYWELDTESYIAKVSALTVAAGDHWFVELGMFDHSPGNLRNLHQCEFRDIVGSSDGDVAFLFMLDAAWNLGTKEWDSVGTPPVNRPAPGLSPFSGAIRYLIKPERKASWGAQTPSNVVPQPIAPRPPAASVPLIFPMAPPPPKPR